MRFWNENNFRHNGYLWDKENSETPNPASRSRQSTVGSRQRADWNLSWSRNRPSPKMHAYACMFLGKGPMKTNKAPHSINEKDLLEEWFVMFCFLTLAGERNSYALLIKKTLFFADFTAFLKNVAPFWNILYKLPHFTFLDGKLLDFLKKIGLIGRKKFNFPFRYSYQYQIMGFGEDGLTCPRCPYPVYAEYKGTGDLKNAENRTCEEPDPEKY
jgi:hypothetical protein